VLKRGGIVRPPVDGSKREAARTLRYQMTAAEGILWQALRANRLQGLHFRRQQIITGFIVDFYGHDAKLVIEVDGPVHDQQREYDRARDLILAGSRLRVLRFNNSEIETCLPAVLSQITREALALVKPEQPTLSLSAPAFPAERTVTEARRWRRPKGLRPRAAQGAGEAGASLPASGRDRSRSDQG